MKREGEGTIYLTKKTVVIPFCSLPFIFRNYSCRRLISTRCKPEDWPSGRKVSCHQAWLNL
jgi:hypothetical protein